MTEAKPRRFRLSLAGMLLLVAVIAVGIATMRPAVTQVVDVRLGAGPPIKVGDTAIVHYVGTLADGKVFDTSKGRGQPFDFNVGRGRVIRGWDIGLIGMRPGGVRRLTIPPEEAYGKKGAPPAIPPNSTLHFEIELIGIKPAVGQKAPAARSARSQGASPGLGRDGLWTTNPVPPRFVVQKVES